MSFCRTIVLIAAGAVLAGCVATAPQRPGAAEPGSPSAARSVAGDARGDEIEVEAEGIAHMGDKDRREDVEARAERKAIDRAAGKAFGLHVKAESTTSINILIKDTKTQTVVGTFTSVSRIDEEFDGSRYRIRVRAKGRKERVDPPPVPSEEPSPEEQTAKPEAAPSSAPTPAARPDPDAVPDPDTDATAGSPAPVREDRPGPAETAEKRPAPSGAVAPAPSGDAVTVCCHEFRPTLVKRVKDTLSVLAEARGIVRVEEVSATDTELCYRIHHDGSLKSIDEWIERLRTDAARPFKRRHDRGANVIDLVFDAGFD